MANPKSYRNVVGQREQHNYQRFSEEYFAGSDVRIYFGDIWVDEVTSLQFTLQENVAPIFGYASHTYDAVARGSRQIQGTFRINFKESYYLHSITNRLELKLKEGLVANNVPFTANKSTNVEGVTVEQLVKQASNSTEKDFNALADEFEKSLWGSAANQYLAGITNNRPREGWFYPQSTRPILNQVGFNIVMLYGPYAESYKAEGTMPVSTTAHSLIGVHLTSVSQIVDGSGQPIQEEYSFIAKDLDGNVNIVDIPEFVYETNAAGNSSTTTTNSDQKSVNGYTRLNT